MSIEIVDRCGELTESLREFAERRLFFALSRFDSRIQKIELVTNDVNGPRGGVDKACRISVTIRRGAIIVVSDQDAEWGKCIARAAERVGRSVARAVDRGQRFDRTRPLTVGAGEEFASGWPMQA